MSDLIISKKNESYILLNGETHILSELSDVFSFYADGYRFQPKYKMKLWDGKIRMIKMKTANKSETYLGLLTDIVSICVKRGYSYIIDENLLCNNKTPTNVLIEYLNNLNITSKGNFITPRDYQQKGFIDAIQNKRQLLLSVTSSGKSLIIYSMVRYFIDQGLKGLIIVPNVSLIHQLYNDFDDYSSKIEWTVENNIHKIYSGQEKESVLPVYLSTWQSLMAFNKPSKGKQYDVDSYSKKINENYFCQFDFVIVDEAHFVKGIELSSILEKCVNANYRIGLTGTTGNCKANINTIVGLTGPINTLNTTRELMDKKEVADFNIKCLVLNYDIETKKLLKKYKYQEEIKYIISNEKRNKFIKNLVLSMKSNTLVLFNFVEHGKLLFDMISNSKLLDEKRNVYLIYGGVEGEERERIRNIIEEEENSIIIASVQTTGTGISIKNLHNIVFCTGTKSSIRLLQSIGRAIRLHKLKDKATIFDIVDDLSLKSHKNFSMLHFLERIKIYNDQDFDYKLIKIPF